MLRRNLKVVALVAAMVVIQGGLAISSAMPQSGTYDYSHRKRDCNVTVKIAEQTVSGAQIDVSLIRNHFGFGGSIRRWAFDTLGEAYGPSFLKYFDLGTPENEMKWAYIQGDTVKADPDYAKADFLVDFMQKNDIAIRGHNLFWNEQKDWIPKWTWNLNATDFKTAMQERIASAMGHFKDKVVQWDVINEIVHGNSGSTPATTMLDSMTNDPNIFKWILQEARKVDPSPKFVINDYNLIEQYDVADKFIAKVKPLASYYDIVGCEGHFSSSMEKSSYEQKINKLAQQLGKPIWLTEVDFSLTSNQAAKLEELMRSCFANKNVEGIIIWVWCKRKMWRGDITCYFVDSLLQETATGKKWRDVREEWKTKASGTTSASGVYAFNGYQGKYAVTIKNGGSTYVDTFYLEPGTGAKAVTVPRKATPVARDAAFQGIRSDVVRVGGRQVYLTVPREGGRLFLSTYSTSGRLLSRVPFLMKNGCAEAAQIPAGCRVFQIHTAGTVCYTGTGFQLR
jgi:endo-1,4-beta-xylanase